MKKARLVAAILLALPLIVFGGNYFVGLFDLPEGDGSVGDQLLQSMRDGGLMGAIAFSHIVAGVLLVIPKTRFLGGLLQLPISIGILAFHVTMLPAGNGVAVFILVLNLFVLSKGPKWRMLLEVEADDRAR